MLFFLDNGSLTFTFPVLGRADTGGRRRELRPALSVSIYMLLPAFPSISHLLNVQAGRLPGDQLHCGGFCCLPVNEAWQLLHQVSPLADGEDFGIFWYQPVLPNFTPHRVQAGHTVRVPSSDHLAKIILTVMQISTGIEPMIQFAKFV